MKQQQEIKIYNKQKLIKETTKLLNKYRDDFAKTNPKEVEMFINAYEQVITECLRCADQTQSVLCKIFTGITLKSVFKPKTMRKIYGKETFVDDHLEFRCNFSSYFKDAYKNSFYYDDEEDD